MVRFPKAGPGSILFFLLQACTLLSVMIQDIIAKDINTYPIPKGIVRNQGQYPSSVFGYVRNANAVLWFDTSGILIDVHSGIKRHIFHVKPILSREIHVDFNKVVHRINVIDGKGTPTQETIYSEFEIKDDQSKVLMKHEFSDQHWKWIMPHSSKPSMSFKIEGAEKIDIDNTKGVITLYSGDISYSVDAPLIQKGNEFVKSAIRLDDTESLICTIPEKSGEDLLNVPILFTSFIGGGMSESINAIALDQQGSIYVLGDTETPDFPITTGAYDSPNPSPKDLFIAKFDSIGKKILYSARIGGSKLEKGTALVVDSLGQACITGSTTSTDFPSSANSFQPVKILPDEDVFIAKVNASGSALIYGTFLSGMTTDIAHGIALDNKGDIYVTGATGILSKSPHTFPKTIGSYDTSYNGGALDVFIAKINPGNNGKADLKFSTVLGGDDIDIAYKIVIAKNGQIIIGGETASSSLFPISSGAIQSTNKGNSDGFVAMLTPNADDVLYSTYIGGSGYDRITGVMFDELSQSVFYAGYTNSSGIPETGNPNPIQFPITPGAFDTSYNGGSYDGFIGKFEPKAGSSLKFSSFIGGSGNDYITGIGVDVCAAPYVTGNTTSSDFPITDDASDSTNKKTEAFVSKLNALANVLVFSSYFGNEEDDQSNAIVVDGSGAIFIGGSTTGSKIPGSNLSTNARDGYITKIQVGILPLKPIIERKGELSFCKGDSVILDASSRNLTAYQWKKNAGIIPGANTPVLIVKESGVYTVDVADASGCTGSESVSVIAFDRPGLTLDPIVVICPNDTIQLSAKTIDSLSSIQWMPSIGLSCNDCLNPFAFPKVNTVYTLTTIDTNGCSRTDTVKVFVIDSTVISVQDINDTITICQNTKQLIRFPIRNSSEVDLTIDIVSFSDTLLSSSVKRIIIAADSTFYIPIEFAGRTEIGPKLYGVNIADYCGRMKYVECIIDVQIPRFTYTYDSTSDICKTNVIQKKIFIKNANALSGNLEISASDARMQFSQTSLLAKSRGVDSILISFSSDTIGLFPITIRFKHECGNIDSIIWKVNVISNPFAIEWKSDTTYKKSGMSFIKGISIVNQSNKQLAPSTIFDIGLMHEYSVLNIDSVLSDDCTVQLRKDGDTTFLRYLNCKNIPEINANVYFSSVIGETLKPWVNIVSFSSEDPCIDPILLNTSDSIELDSYGCELTTLSIGRANAQLLSVALSKDQSRLSIAYEIKEKMSIDIHCISTVGQTVESIHVSEKEAGMHELTIPVNGLPSGVYALHFGAGRYSASSLFMIME